MSLNIDIFHFINTNLANPVFDVIMPPLSNCGGFITLLAASILAVLVMRYLKNEKYQKIAWMCLYALLLAGIIAAVLKLTFHSPRPYTVLENVRQLTVPSEPNSFPSGHAASTFSVVTVLLHFLKNNPVFTVLLILFALSIAFSRVYIGVHFPSDVLAGAIAGAVAGVVVVKFKSQK